MFALIISVLLIVVVSFLIVVARIHPENNDHINKDFLKDCVYIDTETTGLSRRDRIVEISAIRIRGNQIVDSFNEMVNPHMHIKKGASEVSKITDEMVMGMPDFASIQDRFLLFIGSDILVGHNIRFDLEFMERELGRPLQNPVFDSMQLAKMVVIDIDNYRLATLCRKFGLPEQNHRGLTDAALTFRVVQEMKALAAKKKILLGSKFGASLSK